jgi:hypothetical protein
VAQIVLCWGLLAHKKTYFFIFSEVFFIFFHFYSGLLVEFRYLITNLPAMLLLFLFPREIPYKKTNNFFIHTLFVVLLAMQSIGIVIP